MYNTIPTEAHVHMKEINEHCNNKATKHTGSNAVKPTHLNERWSRSTPRDSIHTRKNGQANANVTPVTGRQTIGSAHASMTQWQYLWAQPAGTW